MTIMTIMTNMSSFNFNQIFGNFSTSFDLNMLLYKQVIHITIRLEKNETGGNDYLSFEEMMKDELKVFISTSESKCDECGEELGRKAWRKRQSVLP